LTDPLVRAFQENRDAAAGCSSPDGIWRAVAGLEPPERAASLIEHTIRCGDCARLWRLAREPHAAGAWRRRSPTDGG